MNIKLKAAIQESGYKQRFIATRAGIDQVRLSKIVHGHISPCDDEKRALAEILNESIENIFPTGKHRG